MALLTCPFEMCNDIHLKCTVRNKKINQGNAVFTPDTDQDIAPKEMEHMTVAAVSGGVTQFSGSFEIEVEFTRTFECKFQVTKAGGVIFEPNTIFPGTPYRIWKETTVAGSIEVKFHIDYKT